jgi:hypothetical protein
VWNENTTISGTLHNGEDLATGSSTSETNIKEGLEWTWTFFVFFNFEEFTISFSNTFVLGVKTKLLKNTTGSKETSGVSGSPVS